MDGLIFGLTDNAVLIGGALTGYEIERLLPKRLQKGAGILYGSALGNTLSDSIGAILDPAMFHMLAGITLGCLVPIVFIPIITKWMGRRKQVV